MADNNNPRWHSFDVENDAVFFKTLIDRSKQWAMNSVPVNTQPVTSTQEIKPVETKPAETTKPTVYPAPVGARVTVRIESRNPGAIKLLLELVGALADAKIMVVPEFDIPEAGGGSS